MIKKSPFTGLLSNYPNTTGQYNTAIGYAVGHFAMGNGLTQRLPLCAFTEIEEICLGIDNLVKLQPLIKKFGDAIQ